MKGRDIFFAYLEHNRVPFLFGNPGTTELPLVAIDVAPDPLCVSSIALALLFTQPTPIPVQVATLIVDLGAILVDVAVDPFDPLVIVMVCENDAGHAERGNQAGADQENCCSLQVTILRTPVSGARAINTRRINADSLHPSDA